MVIVEGLNCAGKTTWIEGQILKDNEMHLPKPIHLITSWANPLRFDEKKKAILHSNFLDKIFDCITDEAYVIGCYETVFNIYKNFGQKIPVYMDRSFITAYAYRTMSNSSFHYIMKMFNTLKIYYVFIDTPVNVCLERFEKIKDKKKYVEIDKNWNMLRDNLLELMKIASNNNFKIIKGE
jgi:thymidylate kinase